MSTRVYIDLGCYDGDSVLQYLQDHPGDTVHAFDPNDSFRKRWRQIEKKYPNIIFHNEAAWVLDGHIEFNQMPPDRPYGSSIKQTKRDWGQGTIKKVFCFDFSDYLSRIKAKTIIIKMDIEGSEYDILEKMINDGTDKLVSELWVEFHDSKISDFDPEQKKWILKNLKCKWSNW